MAYPTPVGKFRVPDPGPLNAALRAAVLAREAAAPSDDHANVGGWHSPADLLDWPDPAVATLKGRIAEAVAHMMAAGGDPAPAGRVAVTAWANVARRGHYHRVHNHPNSAWSGVYYVAAGGDAPAHPLSGVLEFCDPRPFTEMVPAPGSPAGQRAVVRAEAGLMVLFPSWLYHFVNPFQGDGERISIAFNVRWQPAPRA